MTIHSPKSQDICHAENVLANNPKVVLTGGVLSRAKNKFGDYISPQKLLLMVSLVLAVPFSFASAVQVAAGRSASIAIDTDGSLLAWGDNYYGEIGDGTVIDSNLPLKVGSGFVQVDSAFGHTVAVKSDGSLWAWGANDSGQLGDGTKVNKLYPTLVGNGFVSTSASYQFSLAIKANGSLWAWGANGSGQLGDGTTQGHIVPVQIGTGYEQVSTGLDHTVAVKADGSLWTWGHNSSGQLGIGTFIPHYSPVQVGSGFVSASAGYQYTLAVKADGTAWAWGNNSQGQLGIGTAGTAHNTPQLIGSGYATVAAGDGHSAGIKSSGELWAWGSNGSGEVGDGTTTLRDSPVLVGTSFKGVAIGSDHTVALKRDGSVWTWGGNFSGQLGDGTNTSRYSQAPVRPGYAIDTRTSPMSGLWWNEKESGWGFSIIEHGPTIFASWYTYDVNGQPTWYFISNCPVSGDGCTGDIYKATGGVAPGTAWNGATPTIINVGVGSLNFSDANAGSLHYVLNGVEGTEFITRQVFATGATPAVNYGDLWWNANESGWGVTLTQQAGVIVAAWYTYDAAGMPIWYYASCTLAGTNCNSDLYLVSGGSAPTIPWDGTNKVAQKVGTLNFAFSNSQTGTMTSTIAGISQSKTITRLAF
ncbi:MAG: hypothetical protein V4805_09155 [Pseudomonadota bacterium]